ncbi:hypothetical protein Tsp_09429 [Trichinella spiralis]|uniref:hypothetical protein n=1 Tax=Trichinella spiralis TaxID=6334 RepID=UPI0001EFD351|nr:hypothetical protein Tsp_09429 [Trichinella spiralis]
MHHYCNDDHQPKKENEEKQPSHQTCVCTYVLKLVSKSLSAVLFMCNIPTTTNIPVNRLENRTNSNRKEQNANPVSANQTVHNNKQRLYCCCSSLQNGKKLKFNNSLLVFSDGKFALYLAKGLREEKQQRVNGFKPAAALWGLVTKSRTNVSVDFQAS